MPMQLPTVPELAAMIDHAVLKPTHTERDVVDACAIARKEHIASVVGLAHANEAQVKVILETSYLDDAQKVIAAQIAAAAGADFVKTSTGFGPEGATVDDVRLLRQTVGEKLGVKASGGIRTLDEALAMIEAGASRLGTSSTSAILTELRHRRGEE